MATQYIRNFFGMTCILLASACTVGGGISDNGNVKSVGNVRWTKEVGNTANHSAPSNAAGVYFLRANDSDSIQTSANVAINDRFQVSLQPGNYSQVNTCVGTNRIGAEITGRKSNDLLLNAVDYQLQAGQNYYFYVDVDANNRASVAQLDANQAQQMMANMPRQNHQISRVVPNCPAQAPISINLQVLFDTDKSFVKPHYYPEIQQVADYLNRFPDTNVSLEGHTDSRADDKYNIGLSQRRVDAVRNVLIQQFGIAPHRIQAFGYGESMPIADNNSEQGRQMNRRVIAVFSSVTR